MSTEIKDVMVKDDNVTIEAIGDRVELVAYENATMTDVLTSRADFLAAVAKECDVIVVDRAELPEVVARSAHGGTILDVGDGTEYSVGNTPEHMAARRREVYRTLALIEYAQNHPPVDPAEVEALAHLICEHEQETTPAIEVARRLLATGRVQVTL